MFHLISSQLFYNTLKIVAVCWYLCFFVPGTSNDLGSCIRWCDSLQYGLQSNEVLIYPITKETLFSKRFLSWSNFFCGSRRQTLCQHSQAMCEWANGFLRLIFWVRLWQISTSIIWYVLILICLPKTNITVFENI
jgi:hypothetical protein